MSSEMTDEGLASDDKTSSGRSATTFSRTGEGRLRGISRLAPFFVTVLEVKR